MFSALMGSTCLHRQGPGAQGSDEKPVVLEPCEVRPASTITDAGAALEQEAAALADDGNGITPEDVAEAWPEDYTTAMLRQIPRRYSPEELVAELLALGYENTFNFFYLPMDIRKRRNRGYCFINFRDSAAAKRFILDFHHATLERYPTQKILEVVPAEIQGLDETVGQFDAGQVDEDDSSGTLNPFGPICFN
eukprot:TRINITY_DN12913_c0_g1_i7.p1 TRINITY_DN12913_c0_g1~~TRINITY_DN12913_c0_g1_i7.p1  ORF type:complete len:193 (-),score=46.42 TRINITY_DN12913_c0_g1_i7:311-889(-)